VALGPLALTAERAPSLRALSKKLRLDVATGIVDSGRGICSTAAAN